MLKHKETYEIISPEDVGLFRSNESGIVLGKLRYAACSLFWIYSNNSGLIDVVIIFSFYISLYICWFLFISTCFYIT